MRVAALTYLAGLCHGIAAVWVVAYVLWKWAVPSDDLFIPRDGVLPVGMALIPAIAGCTLIQLNAIRWRAGCSSPTPSTPPTMTSASGG